MSKIIDDLIYLLGSENTDDGEEAVNRLVEIGDDAIPALIDVVNDGDVISCVNAIDALGRIGNPQAVETLISALQDTDQNVIITALKSLRLIGDPVAIPHMFNLLTTEEFNIHLYTTHNLAHFDHPDTHTLLVQGLYSDQTLIRYGCVVALSVAGKPDVLSYLIPLASDPDHRVRYSVSYAIYTHAENITDPAIQKALALLLDDSDHYVRQKAEETIERFAE